MSCGKGGWTGRILRIDLTSQKIRFQRTEEYSERFIGGRGIGQWILFNESQVGVHPFDPDNILVFSAGPLVGTAAPGACRTDIESKNTITAGIAYSNAGGTFGPEMKRAGFDHVVVTGRSAKPVYVSICDGSATLQDASALWGKETPPTADSIRQDLGEEASVATIGPAGERLVFASAIMMGRGHVAGGCGLGAVMGSKNLKAIAARGHDEIPVADEDRFVEAAKSYVAKIDSSNWAKSIRQLGTHGLVTKFLYERSMLPVRNCQDDHWDEEKMAKIDMPALAGYRRRSLDCCQMGCGTDFVIESGPYSGTVCDRFQANAGYGFGPRFDIDYPAALIKADALCNELGLDVDNTATILSWCYELYERGILTKDDTDGLDLAWGCHESLLELIGKLAYREGFGSLLADGFRVAADKIGKGSEYYALQVKGQGAIDSFRTAIAWGFGHATSTRGARHLDGSSTTEAEDWPPEAAMRIFGFTFGGQDRYEGKAKLVFWFENLKALVDSLGMCYYTSHWAGPDLLGPADYSKLFTAATGLEKSGDDLMLMGRKIHDVEKAFNTLHAGFTRRDDFPPMRMMMEPVKSGIFAGQRIQWSKYDSMLSDYYELHGWDRHSGWQTRDGLRNLELPEVADKLERAGRLH